MAMKTSLMMLLVVAAIAGISSAASDNAYAQSTAVSAMEGISVVFVGATGMILITFLVFITVVVGFFVIKWGLHKFDGMDARKAVSDAAAGENITGISGQSTGEKQLHVYDNNDPNKPQ